RRRDRRHRELTERRRANEERSGEREEEHERKRAGARAPRFLSLHALRRIRRSGSPPYARIAERPELPKHARRVRPLLRGGVGEEAGTGPDGSRSAERAGRGGRRARA